jgi:hypothetical protein
MQTLNVHWPKVKISSAIFSSMPPDQGTLRQQIAPAAELMEQPLTRLVRRLCSGFPVSLALRAGIDPNPLISWLKAAGAQVSLLEAKAVSS